MVCIIQICDTVTMSERPMGPESLVVLCRPLKMKSVFSRQSVRRSKMSVGDRRVLFFRDGSVSSFCRMSWRQSLIGTEGKRASAS